MVVRQGDVFWVQLSEPIGSAPGYRHPHVIVQNNLVNTTRIQTVIACALTSNLQRAQAPGNVLLRRGEAKLPKKSVVNVSQVITLDKSQLREKIGQLSSERVNEIIAGLKLLLEPREYVD